MKIAAILDSLHAISYPLMTHRLISHCFCKRFTPTSYMLWKIEKNRVAASFFRGQKSSTKFMFRKMQSEQNRFVSTFSGLSQFLCPIFSLSKYSQNHSSFSIVWVWIFINTKTPNEHINVEKFWHRILLWTWETTDKVEERPCWNPNILLKPVEG